MGMQMNSMNSLNNVNMGMGTGTNGVMMPLPPPPRPPNARPGTAHLPPQPPALGDMLPPSRPTIAASLSVGSPTAPFVRLPQMSMGPGGSPRRRTNSGGFGTGPDATMGMGPMGGIGVGPNGGMNSVGGVGGMMSGMGGPASIGGMPGAISQMPSPRVPDPMVAAAAAVTSPMVPKREQSESLPPPSRAGKPAALPAPVPPKPAKTEATVHGTTLERATTRVSYVKPDDFTAMSEDEVAEVKGWMEADKGR
ncbi:unnamed protein product [Peniophora sp. CBMAI 1063]|nr:unnamed protein product [Peniophora sp. CBMAI 1063]